MKFDYFKLIAKKFVDLMCDGFVGLTSLLSKTNLFARAITELPTRVGKLFVAGIVILIFSAVIPSQVFAQNSNTQQSSLPVISLSTSTPSITEGGIANITFSSDQTAPTNGLQVNYSISQEGGYIDNFVAGTQQVLIPAGESSKVLILNTVYEYAEEPDGEINVSLLADDNLSPTYTISTTIESQSASIIVNNDDLSVHPEVTLSAAVPSIVEGQIAKIKISTDQVALPYGLQVNYSISEDGNHLASYDAGTHQTIIPAGQSSIELSFNTEYDNVDEPDGSFTISLVNDSSYLIGTESAVTVNIRDNTNNPLISIVDARPVYTSSGAVAEFYLKASNFIGTRKINVSVSGVTKSVEWRKIPTTVLIEGSGSKLSMMTNDSGALLQVPIHSEQILSQNGQIIATILPPANPSEYRVGTRNSRQLSVSSFDLPHSTPLPKISASALSRQNAGEEEHYFKLSLSSPSATPITVNYLAQYTNANVSIYNPNWAHQRRFRTVTITAGSTEYEFPYSKLQDLVGSTNNLGKLEISLLNGLGYVVAPSPKNYAEIDLRNQNKPSGISISTLEYIREYLFYAPFVISASEKSESDRIINVEVSDGTSDFLLFTGPSKIILPAGEFQTKFHVKIVDDDIDEPDGVITATILPGTGYTVASTENSTSLKIYDNDGTPMVSLISANIIDSSRYKWFEGDSAAINLYHTSPIPDDTIINLRVSDGTNNIYNGAESRTLSWNDIGRYSLHSYNRLMIDTHDDEIVEDNGQLLLRFYQVLDILCLQQIVLKHIPYMMMMLKLLEKEILFQSKHLTLQLLKVNMHNLN